MTLHQLFIEGQRRELSIIELSTLLQSHISNEDYQSLEGRDVYDKTIILKAKWSQREELLTTIVQNLKKEIENETYRYNILSYA